MKTDNFPAMFSNCKRITPPKMILRAVALILALALNQAEAGTLIPDRASLNSLLGDTALTEDFERFNLHSELTGDQPELIIFSPCLDSSTIIGEQFGIPAQGPGLVVDGVTFCGSGHLLDIRDGGGHLFPSKVLHLGGTGPTSLLIDFTEPVTAFGFDYFPFITIGTDVSLTIFGADDTTVLENDDIRVFFSGTFIGVSESRGIGSVQISSRASDFGIFDTTIDNLTFGGPSATVPFDIKPTSCRNPLNVNVGEKAVLPAAILGTATFDVTEIDPASVQLEGVPTIRWSLEDVATPFVPFTGKSAATDCTDEGPDGFTDLTLKFNIRAVVNALGGAGVLTDGQVVVLHATGNLLDGTSIVGEDVVVILKK